MAKRSACVRDNVAMARRSTPTDTHDEALKRYVDAYVAGDATAWDQLYASYYGSLRKMVLNMINSMGIDKNLRAQALNDIDDIVNDTMLKLYKGMRDFKRESTFKTWAYAIARNVLVDYLRHLSVKTCRRMDMDVSDLAPHHHPAADIATNPLALLLEDEQIQGQREKLHRYLDALPSKFKAVGNLLLMGKSYQQIADQLQIPLNTVRTRIYRLTNRAHRSDD